MEWLHEKFELYKMLYIEIKSYIIEHIAAGGGGIVIFLNPHWGYFSIDF